MELVKKINEKVLFISILSTMFVGAGCLDSEGSAPWRLLAVSIVVMVGSLIAYYWLEEDCK